MIYVIFKNKKLSKNNKKILTNDKDEDKIEHIGGNLMSSIFICGIILSILQSILFWEKEPGISVLLFMSSFIIGLIYLMYKHKKVENKKAFIFAIPIILLSATYFIYHNTLFQTINVLVIVILTIIMCIYTTRVHVKVQEFLTKAIELLAGSFESISDVIDSLKNKFKKKEDIENEKSAKLKQGVKSFVYAIPVILIVFILLMSADSVFANIFEGIFGEFQNIFMAENFVKFCLRICVIMIFFFIFSGFFVNILKKDTMFNSESEEKIVEIHIEKMTIDIILTILNIFYLIFSIIQFTSLFSNMNTNDFDYATYARQGFFQLMIISFINIVMIILAKVNKGDTSNYTKGMSILTLLFTMIILLSAFFRMNLYEKAYGYTYLRLFVYYILATEFILILPIGLWILDKKIDILKWTIGIVTVMYVILNFSNIESTIAKRNVDRYFENQEENEIDLDYLFNHTGTDAIGQMKRLLNAKDETVAKRVKEYLLQEKEDLQDTKTNWQETNLSEIKAKEELMNIK